MKSPMNSEIDYPVSICLFNSQSHKPYQNSYLLEYNQIYQQHINSHKE